VNLQPQYIVQLIRSPLEDPTQLTERQVPKAHESASSQSPSLIFR
jgi:hypothetical protein